MLVTIEIDTDEVGSVRQWSERLHYDEGTMVTVRDVMTATLAAHAFVSADEVTKDLINNLQNAGILFRERLPIPERTKN